ncbi:transporter substrate-binding domain-containing protein [Sutterella sp.]|uniref:transporter substrate-binding domain-containing protein n=1 Tax=Sutterella sp. TaxID=1981025 RepID=UPI0026DF8DCE|nr:transporter substrate-binding domain-containing protein [Sutterella sp.]MDO5532164.1 transporter substrate-binding domain-containing protein [Sutterella sp.]
MTDFKLTRRTLVAAALAAGALSAAGTAFAAEDLLERIQKKGTLTIGTEGTWAPWTYHDENDRLTGFDVELGRKLAAKLGVKADLVEGKWDGLLAGIRSGRYDIMINGVAMTAARQKAFLFSTPYAFNRTVVIVRKDSDRIHSMADLKGLTTANTISSNYADIAERAGAKVIGVDDLNQTLELLFQGRIDATLNAEVVFRNYMKVHPDAAFKIAAVAPQATPIAMPMPMGAGSAALKAKVDAALEELRASGELAELSNQFFGADITKQ